MENNFYVGTIYHSKKLVKPAWKEKAILYTEDKVNYIDLITSTTYPLGGNNNHDYVEENSLVKTDVTDYKTDYYYLLTKYKNAPKEKTKKRYCLK